MTEPHPIDGLISLISEGKFQDAEQATKTHPDLEQSDKLCNILGGALFYQNRIDEAEDWFQRAITLNPNYARAWVNLGNVYKQKGDLTKSLNAYYKSLTLDPKDTNTWFHLGLAHSSQGDLEKAEDSYQNGLRNQPSHLGCLINLGVLISGKGRLNEALDYLNKGLALSPQDPNIHNNIAITLKRAKNADLADEHFRKALAVAPNRVDIILNRCELLEQHNRLDTLDQFLDVVSERNITAPDLSYFHALNSFRQNDIATSQAWLDQISPDDISPSRVLAFYELRGKCFDYSGASKDAMEMFDAMNALSRAGHKAMIKKGDDYLARAVARAKDITSLNTTQKWTNTAKDTDSQPIFIVGFIRSGTTLLDTILSGHPDLHVVEEKGFVEAMRDQIGIDKTIPFIEELDQQTVTSLKDTYEEGIALYTPNPKPRAMIDRLPLNLVEVPLIARVFPKARFIFCLRHPMDTVLSGYMQNFRLNAAMAAMTQIKTAAALYDATMTIWQNSVDRYQLDHITITYEDLVEDREPVLRSLLSYLDLPWHDGVLEHWKSAEAKEVIATPSYRQVVQPIYTIAIDRWRRYQPFLKDAEDLLAPWVEAFGYSSKGN
jgi:tetratricopeptide (TPR) repeat protein